MFDTIKAEQTKMENLKNEKIKAAQKAWAEGNLAVTVDLVIFVIGVFIVTLFLGLVGTGATVAFQALNSSYPTAGTIVQNIPTLVVALILLGIVVAGTAYFYGKKE